MSEGEAGVATHADEHAATLDSEPCGACGRANPIDARFCGGCGQPLRSVEQELAGAADPLIGRVIADRYRILALLGRGGMGVVYKVEHVHIGKLMAVKLLHGELARDRNTLKRFEREVEAVSRLSHPNTVQVFDFGRSEGLVYLVMEYLDGKDLGQLIREEGPLPFARVARILAQVCASVAEAHALGIVHRDLKPENVMILGAGREIAKVLDFGLAKLRDQSGGVTVTRAGAIIGTPYYMSPEQIRGEEVDARGDIYAIGAVLYKACTGVAPFVANTPMGVLTKHLTEELVLPSRRSEVPLPPQVDAIVDRAMRKDPAERYQSVEELREALLQCLSFDGEVSEVSLPSGVITARADEAFATRRDVDAYERRLRRRGILGYVLLAVIVLGLGLGGFRLWEAYQGKPAVLTAEVEPNDEPDQANPLPMGVPLEGYLGQRRSAELGDADLYRIRNESGSRKLLQVEVGPLPNIDLVVDVIRVGQHNPLLSADSGPAGVGERIPNFPINEGDYLLRVRERWIVGELPTENVSDRYTIVWNLADLEEGWESEVNDSLELADELGADDRVRGYVGWGGDVDLYCFAEAAPAVTVEVTGVSEVDLALREVDRDRAASRKANAGGAGEGESVQIEDVRPGRSCVEVAAIEAAGVRRANGEVPYELRVRRAPSPVEAP